MKKSTVKTVAYNFRSISEMRELCVSPSARAERQVEANKHIYDRAVMKGKSQMSWYGLDSTTDCLNAIENGNEQLTKKLMAHNITKKLPRAIGIGRQLFRGDMGDELDIHAVNGGRVDRAWSAKRRVVKRARNNIKIVVDIGANCNVEASVLQCRGLAGAGLAIALEKAGYSVAVIAAFGSRSVVPDKHLLVTCTIKPAVGRISAGILATTVCLPGFFRTYGFGAIVRAADLAGVQCHDGLGQTLAAETLLPDEPATMAIVVPVSVISDESAQAWILETITLLERAS